MPKCPTCCLIIIGDNCQPVPNRFRLPSLCNLSPGPKEVPMLAISAQLSSLSPLAFRAFHHPLSTFHRGLVGPKQFKRIKRTLLRRFLSVIRACAPHEFLPPKPRISGPRSIGTNLTCGVGKPSHTTGKSGGSRRTPCPRHSPSVSIRLHPCNPCSIPFPVWILITEYLILAT